MGRFGGTASRGFIGVLPPKIVPTSFSSKFCDASLDGLGADVICTPSARSSSFCSMRASDPFLFSSIS